MDDFFLALCFIALFILLFGLVSRIIKDNLFISEPLISLAWGILIGPSFLNLLNTSYFQSKKVLYYLSKTVLCIQTMTAAMSLPHGYILSKMTSLVMIVIVVGFIKYFVTFIIIYLFTHYNAGVSMAIAACLTPTDPVLSSSIVKSRFADENVPARLRHLIAAESGINDGFGLLLLYIPMDLFFLSHSVNEGIFKFFVKVLLYKIVLSALLGLLIGYVARKLLYYCYSCDMVGLETFLVYGLALTFFVFGLTQTLKMSELVCVFFTGTAFTWDEWFVFETRESKLQEVTDSLFTSSFFVLFGSRFDFNNVNVSIVVCSLIILCLRRPFACLAMWRFIPEIKSKREALFVGWFGPVGVGALYYALYFDRKIETLAFDVVSVVVVMSVVVHGLTIPVMKIANVGDESIGMCALLPVVKSTIDI